MVDVSPGVSMIVTPGLSFLPNQEPLEYVLSNVLASTPCPTLNGPDSYLEMFAVIELLQKIENGLPIILRKLASFISQN